MKKILKIILFVTSIIWFVPFAIYTLVRLVWNEVSEFIDERIN